MPFKHIVDKEKNIVVYKAIGKVSVPDMISEIQKAINTKRGEGISRRMIDMTGQMFSFDTEDILKVLKMMLASANILGSKRMAIIFDEIPDSFEFKNIESPLRASNIAIRFFTDKAEAIQFLNIEDVS